MTRAIRSQAPYSLAVAILGDMARPEIIFKNAITSLFGSDDRGAHPLPLPAWASQLANSSVRSQAPYPEPGSVPNYSQRSTSYGTIGP